MAKKKTKGRASRPRRGKSEAVTGAKAGQVEVRAALSQGDLQLPAVDDYNHHKKNIAGCLDSLESAKSRYRKALQSAQSAGIDTDAMLEARRIVRANDPKKTANKLNQLAFALEQEGFSIHITVHDTLAGDQEDLVARRFFEDGKAGRTFDCRYPENSDLAQIAKDNWMKGQAELLGVGGSEPAHDLKSLPGLSDDQHVTH
jgi:hypothetical protein